MSMLTDALIALKTKINLQHIDLTVGASSLDTIAVSVGTLADIKTSTCINCQSLELLQADWDTA